AQTPRQLRAYLNGTPRRTAPQICSLTERVYFIARPVLIGQTIRAADSTANGKAAGRLNLDWPSPSVRSSQHWRAPCGPERSAGLRPGAVFYRSIPNGPGRRPALRVHEEGESSAGFQHRNHVAVRHSDSDPSRNCRTLRVLRRSRRFPTTIKKRLRAEPLFHACGAFPKSCFTWRRARARRSRHASHVAV